MAELTPEKINNILDSYKRRVEKDKIKYLKNKDNEDFKIANRARAKAHYEANKELKAKKYQDNKELLKCKALLNYYKYHNRINDFIEKYPDKVDLMKSYGLNCSGSGSGSAVDNAPDILEEG